MSISLYPANSALAINCYQSFSPSGGVAPYTFSISPGGANGTVDSNGLYRAPTVTGVDTVVVTDSLGATSTSHVKILTPVELVCDVLQTELALADGKVYLWDQKIKSPTDSGLWIAVSELTPKIFGASANFDPVLGEVQSINMRTTLSIDIISRSAAARDMKEQVAMSLGGYYSRSQQEKNGFRIFPVMSQINNISGIDGSAIPYRFNFSVNIQYMVKKTSAIPYYDTFNSATVTVDP